MIALSEDTRDVILEKVATLIDAAGPSGRIEFLTVDDVVVAELRFSFPCASAPIGGTMLFGPIFPDGVKTRASGKASVARITDAAGSPVFHCDVSEPDGDAFVKLNSTDIEPGAMTPTTSRRAVLASVAALPALAAPDRRRRVGSARSDLGSDRKAPTPSSASDSIRGRAGDA